MSRFLMTYSHAAKKLSSASEVLWMNNLPLFICLTGQSEFYYNIGIENNGYDLYHSPLPAIRYIINKILIRRNYQWRM
ncbi:MAG: hypothetical protein A2Z50_05295 [Nitrospirae bacterium RBG_19FT_COMBO_42_15]|nr:MAG: hypothetical protein A2Z50_05295 [Nitrospirae bacterium RBG_19FT_COMBO_42_15]